MSSRVLLVDSDLALLRTMRSAAVAEGGTIELLTAQTWEEAFELLTIAEPALVVGAVDRTTSPELASLCQLQRRGLAVAAFGPDVPELVRVAASAGVSEYICKPISTAAFFVRVQRLIRAASASSKAGLKGFALADLLQLVSMSKQSMTLRVRSGEQSAELVVADGTLVHAETGDARGLDAAVTVLDWADAEVSSSPDVPPRASWTAEVPLMELLVNAARLRDERQRDDANRQLERLVSRAVDLPGVFAAALIHVASRTEVYGSGNAGEGRAFARELLLDALSACAEQPEGERPSEVQFSMGPCDAMACPIGDTGIAMLVWCDPGELRSGTQLALQRARERDADEMARAFSTIEIELGGGEDGTPEDVEF
ncbi:MAG: DUF4388 domain-containing protein [Nannocystaceae bacterium]|nr:DUF4388 domain-containing protein [bacterium]